MYASEMEVFGAMEASVQHAGELAGKDNIAMRVPVSIYMGKCFKLYQ